MPSLPVIKTALREVFTRSQIPRTPEPDLVMDDPNKVAAYTRAGREDGVMAPVYLFNCAQICEVLREGDLVLDLACGPATQLAQVARLNPTVQFIGIDLSESMLERARAHVREKALTNVEIRQGDISNLSVFGDASVDAIFSTMALHHLPDQSHLTRCLQEVARVLKPDGGLYLVDFSRLRAESSVQYFAYQYADRQPELFTLDYLYSLRAAFSVDDFEQARLALGNRARLFRMFLMPFMVALKSQPRAPFSPALKKEIDSVRAALPPHHQADIQDMLTLFRLGGLRSAYLD